MRRCGVSRWGARLVRRTRVVGAQICRALFEQAAAGRHQARSAGTTPGDLVHPEVLDVMAEEGIDLSGRTPIKEPA